MSNKNIGTYSVKVNAQAGNFQQVFKSLQEAGTNALKGLDREFTQAELAAMEFDKRIQSINNSIKRGTGAKHFTTLLGLQTHYAQLPKQQEFRELGREGGYGIAKDIIKLRKDLIDAMLRELNRQMSGEQHLSTLGQLPTSLRAKITNAKDSSYQYLSKAKEFESQQVYSEYIKNQRILNALIDRYRQAANPNLYKGRASGQMSIARVRTRMNILESHPDFQNIMSLHTPDPSTGQSRYDLEQQARLSRESRISSYQSSLKKNSSVLWRQMEREEEARQAQEAAEKKRQASIAKMKRNSRQLEYKVLDDEIERLDKEGKKTQAFQARLKRNSLEVEYRDIDRANAEREAAQMASANNDARYRNRQQHASVRFLNSIRYSDRDSDSLLSEFNTRSRMMGNTNRAAAIASASPTQLSKIAQVLDIQRSRQDSIQSELERRGYQLSNGKMAAPHWATVREGYAGPTSGYRSSSIVPDEVSKSYVEGYNKAKRYADLLSRIDTTKLRSADREQIVIRQLEQRKMEMQYYQADLAQLGYVPNKQGLYEYNPGQERSFNRKMFLGSQLAYGVDDAVSQLSAYGMNPRGFAAALRGAGNNLTAAIPYMGMSPGKAVPGIVGGTFALAGVSAAATYIADTEKAIKVTDQLESSIKQVANALERKFKLDFEVKNSSASSMTNAINELEAQLVSDTKQATFTADQAQQAAKDLNRNTRKRSMFGAVYDPDRLYYHLGLTSDYDYERAKAASDLTSKEANDAAVKRNQTKERLDALKSAEPGRRALEDRIRMAQVSYDQAIAVHEARTGRPMSARAKSELYSQHLGSLSSLKDQNPTLIDSIIRDVSSSFQSTLRSDQVQKARQDRQEELKGKQDFNRARSLQSELSGSLDKEQAIRNEYQAKLEEISGLTGISDTKRNTLLDLNSAAEEKALYEYRKQKPFGHKTQSAIQPETFASLDYRNKLLFNWEDPLRKATDRTVAAINAVNSSVKNLGDTQTTVVSIP